MVMQICRNIRCYANRFLPPAKALCAERFSSMGARPYSSVPLSQIPGLPPAATLLTAFRSAVNVSGYAFFAGCTYFFGCYPLRKEYAYWKAEKNVQAMLEKLERGKHESEDAFLEVLDREVNALKVELSNRHVDVLKLNILKRDADIMKLDINKREVAALKEKVFSWADEVDNETSRDQ